VRLSPVFMLVAGVIGLAGCATPDTKAEWGLQTILAQPLVADSILRDGDVLSFQLPTNVPNQSIQVEAACSSKRLRLTYLNSNQRVYSTGSAQYGPGSGIPEKLRPILAANPSFIQACAQTPTPDWRRLSADDHGIWLLLDRNSLSTAGDEVRFWGAIDSPVIRQSPPHNAPYAQQRERYAVSCGAGTFKRLASYSLDASNQVSDGGVDRSPPSQAIASGNPQQRALLAKVCEGADKVAGLEPSTPRVIVPLPVTLPAVAPAILAAIEQLNLDPPSRSLKYLRVTGTSTFRGVTEPVKEERFFSSDPVSGQLNVAIREEDAESYTVGWRGLLALYSKASFTGSPRGMQQTTTLTQLSYSGDWKTLPVGKTVSFTRAFSTVNDRAGPHDSKPATSDCRVERELAASELHPRLLGKAKALACQDKAEEVDPVSRIYYLEDYGYFFRASLDKNPYSYNDHRIDTFE